MAYSELIKNFDRIRDYMREFYVYGYKNRSDYDKKSSRSYDDERRRIEGWLADYIRFGRNSDGKNVYISIDSRVVSHNPLYVAWKTKSFTDGDITLHFLLMDILSEEEGLSISEIMDEIDDRLSAFLVPKTFDESNVRKKLKEYSEEGIVECEKSGRQVLYKRAAMRDFYPYDVLGFYSEMLPCGVIGSYILDKKVCDDSILFFKHHYITSAMDSEILCTVFLAMSDKKKLEIATVSKKVRTPQSAVVVPLKVMISAQSGRQYMMAYDQESGRIRAYRLDNIVKASVSDVCDNIDELMDKYEAMRPHIWGVSTQGSSGARMEHIDFTIRYGRFEDYIPKRLEREKRCGTVTYLDDEHVKFSADVYDIGELIPWIRTYICRITEIHMSDGKLEERFLSDIKWMYEMYGIEEVSDGIQ